MTDTLDLDTKEKFLSYENESSTTFFSKVIPKLKAFCRQTDRKTNRQGNIYMPPSINAGA